MTTTNSATAAAASGAGASTKTAASRVQLNANFNTFVKMLTTQLQFQDPLKPMDTTEFTNQLVMYSQVEQQLNSNDKLDRLISLQQGQGVQAALGYMGWEVSTNSSNLPLQNGEGHFIVSVSKPAATVSLSVTDANGKYVRGLSLSNINATTGELVWDGKDSNGNKVPDGTYKISVAAKDTAGSPVPASVKTYGIVTAVDVDGSGNTILKMGDTAIAPRDITSVRTPVKAATTAT